MRSLFIGGLFLALSGMTAVAQNDPLWGIEATVSVHPGDPVPYTVKTFFSFEECEAFRKTPEFLSSVDGLKAYETASHPGSDISIETWCVEL